MSPLFSQWATKVRKQYYKHHRDAEVMETALEAAENILDELRKIPETTLAYVTQESYKSFFARKNFIVLTKISCIDLLFFPYLHFYIRYKERL